MAHDVVILVQDEIQYGNGHTARSARVSEALRYENVAARTVYSSELSSWSPAAIADFMNSHRIVILDCVKLSRAYSVLAQHPCVICISPIFNHANWINHWITYITPKNYDKTCCLYLDKSFRVFDEGAFVNQLNRIKSEKILVCVSGNPEMLFRYEQAIYSIINSGIWSQVRIIQNDMRIPPTMLQSDLEIEIDDFMKDGLWSDGVMYNTILTGSGLIVREAISRGYPVIAMSDNNTKQKLTDLLSYEHFFVCNNEPQIIDQTLLDVRRFTKKPLPRYCMQSGEGSIAKQIMKIMEIECL